MINRNVFIYANSYSAKTFIFSADHLFNFKMSEIYLLKENNIGMQKLNDEVSIIVKECSKIEDIVNKVDMVIVLKDENIPEDKLKYIIQASKELNKECILIDNPWYISARIEKRNLYFFEDDFISYKNKPMILSISVGEFSQQYCIEMLLNKILSKEGVDYLQKFSNSTNHLIAQLSKYGILRNDINLQLKKQLGNEQVIVHAISIEDLSDPNIETNFFKNITPDFIIVSCMADYTNCDELYNYLWYKFGLKIDMLVVSPYLLFEKYENKIVAIYNDDKILQSKLSSINIQDQNVEKIVGKSIFSKMTIPEEIKIVK